MSQASLELDARAVERGWPQALGWLALYVGLCVALFRGTVLDMARTWLDTAAFNHGFVILPISLALVWRRRGALAALRPERESWALVPLALGSAGWLLGSVSEAKLAMQLCFVGMLIAATVAALGFRVARHLAFPLLFLFAMVPFGDFLVPSLQDFTARFAVALLRLLQIPVFLDGVMIDLPNGRFHVAEACAGLRFMIANVVMAALFAHLSFRRWWKSAVFMALSVAVPLVANGLRAFGIILIGQLTDDRAAIEADHIVYGWGFFVVIMLLLLAVGNRFADAPAAMEVRAPTVTEPGARIRSRWSVALAPTLAIAAGPVYASVIEHEPAIVTPFALLAPPAPAGWHESAAGPSNWRPSFFDADARRLTVFQRGGQRVEMFVAYYTHERPDAKLLRYENRFDNDPWTRIGLGRHTPPGADAAAVYERLAGRGQQRAVLAWYWVDGRLVGNPTIAKLLRVAATLGGGPREAAVIALSAEADESGAALATLDAFSASLPSLVPAFAGALPAPPPAAAHRVGGSPSGRN
ncbi:exosortase A [Azospirillum canadense]|uniref:exosortase A n=1 Tax=Azospirillum canadense TaxID=403962 RepID=UPI002227DE5E|nr:exosortase A [Azospirillum canadense]MCW2240892.1 exosortase A [Azospirillum canadense]